MSLVSQARRQAGEVIARFANEIAQSWRDEVRADQRIEGDDRLPDLLLTNQIPALLAEIADALVQGDSGDGSESSIARRRRGIRFGKLRGLARYDVADLYREFKHLRQSIWKSLRKELDWSRGDAFEVMLVIDQYLDEVIGASLRGFMEATERTQARDSGEAGGDGPPDTTAPPKP